jgi:hypothetical protein
MQSVQDVLPKGWGQGRRVDYIEHFDNPKRRHSAISYTNPIKTDAQAQRSAPELSVLGLD